MKKLKQNKKKLKGMTLLEVVVAIAVFAVAATLLVEAGLSVIYNVRSSKNLVKKVNYQSKIVAARPDPGVDSDITEVGDMVLSLDAVGFSGAPVLSVKGYEAEREMGTDAEGNPVELYEDVAGNLKYFVNN
ncbi:MAG: prepilin-type N-terminal cleavage/methylation domain-containing protein [Oscillospiraceae bacterium]|nr:prepilin-type N-terminal cleavage/methylation domain-containing protein [Oscillospiraceae bacterium]